MDDSRTARIAYGASGQLTYDFEDTLIVKRSNESLEGGPATKETTIRVSASDVPVITAIPNMLNRTVDMTFGIAAAGGSGETGIRPDEPTLDTPISRNAAINETSTTITWSPIERATSYEMTTGPATTWTETAGNNPSCTSDDLTEGASYTASVTAAGVNPGMFWKATSSPTDLAFFVDSKPEAILLNDTDVTAGDTSAVLTLDTPTNTPSPITSYEVETCQASNVETFEQEVTDTATVTVDVATLTTLTSTREFLTKQAVTISNRITHRVRVDAVDSNGHGSTRG